MAISNRTLACLIRAYQTSTKNHNGVDLDILEFGLSDQINGTSVNSKSFEFLKALHDRACEGNDYRDLIEVTERTLERANYYSEGWPNRDRLLNTLSLDGYEYNAHSGKLIPTTPDPASLAPEISKLEQDLTDAGLTVAVTHYKQAYENFTAGSWEACNGAVRSFLENLFIELERGSSGENVADALAAIQRLKNAGYLDVKEHHMFNGFWKNIHDEGPHHGISSKEEALFRLHVGTAIGRYLLQRLSGVT